MMLSCTCFVLVETEEYVCRVFIRNKSCRCINLLTWHLVLTLSHNAPDVAQNQALTLGYKFLLHQVCRALNGCVYLYRPGLRSGRMCAGLLQFYDVNIYGQFPPPQYLHLYLTLTLLVAISKDETELMLRYFRIGKRLLSQVFRSVGDDLKKQPRVILVAGDKLHEIAHVPPSCHSGVASLTCKLDSSQERRD